jgi:hypothetical protein
VVKRGKEAGEGEGAKENEDPATMEGRSAVVVVVVSSSSLGNGQ